MDDPLKVNEPVIKPVPPPLLKLPIVPEVTETFEVTDPSRFKLAPLICVGPV
jgi:hypothetical protein